ncbi:MAG: amidohydrolase family protein [Chitinophagales bacterium]
MIIDAHAHVSTTDYGSRELLLSQLDESGVDAALVVPGGMADVRRMTDYITGRATPETVPNNSYVEESVRAEPQRLGGFFCVDPHLPGATEALADALARGFLGLKLSPITHQFSFASKAVAELSELCGQRGVPVYSHTLFNPGASTARFVSLAREFPGTNFILGHLGFGPADQEGLEAACALDNFFLESSTGNFLHLQAILDKAGPAKLIFGSEFPLSHPKAELEKILLLKAPGEALDLILGGNIMALTGWRPGPKGGEA